MIQAEVAGTDHLIFKAIGKDSDSDMIDLNNFADLIDVYIYYPVKEAVKSQQGSPQMHYILSSNTQ